MTVVATEFTTLDIMFELVLEDGRLWGEVACEQQIEDIEAVASKDGPNKHFWTRPRGGSKSSDMAGLALSALKASMPRRSRGYVVASNVEQAGEVIDAAAGFIDRTPTLEGVLRVENERIVNDETGAWVRVIPASESGAWGKRFAVLLICDEFCQWPDTRGARRVWSAVRTTVQKTPGCQLVIMSSSGDPAHWSKPIWDNADSPRGKRDGWRRSDMPGPVPWQDPGELESLEHELTIAEYKRLILNQWAADDDRGITEEEWDEAAIECTVVREGRITELRTRLPKPGVRYVETIDIGTVNDATVIDIAHKEPLDAAEPKGAQRVIVDYHYRWQGTKASPVRLRGEGGVEQKAAELSWEYNRARVYADPAQFLGSLEGLNKLGIKAEEFTFSATSVGQVASALVQSFRNRLTWVPNHDVLKTELLKVRLRDTSTPGVTRLDHDSGEHDDQAVTIGMACHILLGRSAGSFAAFKAYLSRKAAEREHMKKNPATGDRTDSDAVGRFLRQRQGEGRREARRAERRRERCPHRWQIRADGSRYCILQCGEGQPVERP